MNDVAWVTHFDFSLAPASSTRRALLIVDCRNVCDAALMVNPTTQTTSEICWCRLMCCSWNCCYSFFHDPERGSHVQHYRDATYEPTDRSTHQPSLQWPRALTAPSAACSNRRLRNAAFDVLAARGNVERAHKDLPRREPVHLANTLVVGCIRSVDVLAELLAQTVELARKQIARFIKRFIKTSTCKFSP